jgi:hypothetical protein
VLFDPARGARKASAMRTLDDVARFRADDDAQLVAVSLACPLCLGLEVTARLVLGEASGEVECGCGCGTEWAVAVDPAQALRLALAPPSASDGVPLRMLAPRRAGVRGRRAA